jgi:chorismate mutase
MPVRGIRGATTCAENTAEAITDATRELLEALSERNQIDSEEIAIAHFTTTPDLNAEFPAIAARKIGWVDVPLLCGHDINVRSPNPRAISHCIRILILWNTNRPQREMKHVYLRGAQAIQRDLEKMREALAEDGAIP